VASDKKTKKQTRIYLDYAATTPTDPEVLAKMLPYFGAEYSNPSSLHESGRRAHQTIEEARANVAEVLNAMPEEIIFTGSGTESDNLAVVGTARANRSHGNHIIISAIEHKAVIESARQLEKEGFVVSVLPVDVCGKINIRTCLSLVTDKTILVSVMHANNEIGTIEPIAELARALRKPFPLLHTDACQVAGFLSLDVQKLGVDLMTLNSSKVYGPKGVGILYKRKDVRIAPVIVGGEQEKNYRAGTESVPLIVGMVHALKKANARCVVESKRLIKLRDYFIAQLQKKITGLVLNGHPTDRLPNNVHISVPFIEGESMLLMLDQLGIECSTGSACSASDLKPSHVLLAIGHDESLAHGSLRFSLGITTTHTDLDRVLSVLPGIVERLRKMSALTIEK